MSIAYVLLLAISNAAAADCPRPTTAADVEATVAKARAAYAAQDHVSLAAAVVDGRAALECVVEPVRPELAEALHFSLGLWVAVEQGDSAAVPYLAAGRVRRGPGALALDLTEPESALVDRVGPALEAFSFEEGAPVAPPLRGHLALDGQDDARHFPAAAPMVVQRISGGAVKATAYVAPGADPPEYVHRRPVLAITGGTLAAGTGGLLVGAALSRSALFADRDSPLTADEVDTLQARNHAMLVAAGATGTLSALSLGALAFTYRW